MGEARMETAHLWETGSGRPLHALVETGLAIAVLKGASL
jgi:hypothetical protein